jgi:hypothetical protein
VSTSTNGSTFTQVWAGTLHNQRGAQVIPFTATSATHVRITVNNNWQSVPAACGPIGGTNDLKIASVDVLTN